MSARHHAEWLSLLEISGPFLSMPVLLRVFPQGLDADEPDIRRELRLAYEEWQDNQLGLRPENAIHNAWVRYVLTQTLELSEEVIAEGQSIPPTLKATIAEQGETLRPDLVIVEPEDNRTRLLIQIVPIAQELDKPLVDRHWKASPAMRMMELLHATNVRLGLVTNGEQWMLVNAPRGETTGFISWYAALWFEEPMTFRAFRSLLGVYRFFGVSDDETLKLMLSQSAEEQHEVTEQLGYQVRRAVAVLVQAMSRADREADGRLLADVTEAELYEAALTMMMRLVFLFSAEERGLFPLDDPLYNEYYAASTLRPQLREAADQFGEAVIERRFDAWCRLLATFRIIHGGIQHDRLRLPAYGGSLFDPDRFPFLEGRTANTTWKNTPAEPLPIDNRTVLHLLEALQLLQVKVPGGGPVEARRLSFRALDIEQIGHVYEGLLDHTAKRAETVILGLKGTKNREPDIPLPELEAHRAKDDKELLKFLKDKTARSTSALRNALKAEPDALTVQRLRVACGNDDALYQRALPFAGLIHDDAFGQPLVILPSSVYVTAGVERRMTGTHYTPRSLTEPIVQHTLEPLVYDGPAEGKPQGEWKLRPASDLLDLKICDMAMGSGAFLVQACRYLSERLVEAWELAESRRGKHRKEEPVMITPEGKPTTNLDEAILADTEERLILARRLIADRCLYGVDKNPLAVEMAKLSLWLITLDKNRPFTFLDHSLKCGDSLVGVNLKQLQNWSLDTSDTLKLFADTISLNIKKIIDLRREISNLPVNSVDDQTHKRYLLTQADAIAHDLRRGGDMLLSSYFNDLSKAKQEDLRNALLPVFRYGADIPSDWTAHADLGDVRPFHWELEFPEVFLDDGRDGFDAFVGNPPFIGGKRISGLLGTNYHAYLKTRWNHTRGSADYCAYFFLRGFGNLRTGGTLGLIATNTIAQGDTRAVGLDYINQQDGIIYNATNNQPWPGMAAVVVSVVHVAKELPELPHMLDGKSVGYISSLLDSRKVLGNPHLLVDNADRSHMGTNVVGLGFMMSPEEAQALIDTNPRNKDVLFPYLNGQNLNSNPDQSPSRWIINVFDWPLRRGTEGSWVSANEKQKKAWLRSGIVPDDYPGNVAYEYPDCIAIVREKVYPERRTKKGNYAKLWWQYGRRQERLYEAIAPLRRVLVIALTSRTAAFAFMPTDIVFAHAVGVFAFEEASFFAILQSALHVEWAWKYGSSLKGDLRYTPSDIFETFPFPESPFANHQSLETIGETYHEHRRQIMLDRQEGLTKTYNRFHAPDETAADIQRLRELHVEMDAAVAAAYGWEDIELGHDFHETQQGIRYTISESARREVLGRLLELNHQRYEEEVKAGLHNKKKGKRR